MPMRWLSLIRSNPPSETSAFNACKIAVSIRLLVRSGKVRLANSSRTNRSSRSTRSTCRSFGSSTSIETTGSPLTLFRKRAQRTISWQTPATACTAPTSKIAAHRKPTIMPSKKQSAVASVLGACALSTKMRKTRKTSASASALNRSSMPTAPCSSI